MNCIGIFAGATHRNQVTAVDFDVDGKYIISAGMDKVVNVWKLDCLEEVITGRQQNEEPLRIWQAAVSTETLANSGGELKLKNPKND
jgi:WD40 repeat protein